MIQQATILAAFQQLEEIAGEGTPVGLCIVDEHGFTLGYAQQDGASPRFFTMAQAKAYTAARMKQSTEAFHQRILREQFSLADFADPNMTSMRGGVPVCDTEGKVIGGVGVSGRRPEEDEALALHFVEKFFV